jgi:xanthine dehydrogenase YagR molybdenum-binding subunit
LAQRPDRQIKPPAHVIFLDETDAMSSPMKAKGVAQLGICGVAAAVANAVYNATGIRVPALDRLSS